MDLALNEFLAQLGNETVSRINRETKVKTIQPVKPVKEERQVQMPQHQPKEQPKIIEEEKDINEDFIETALDYANVIIKTVRSSFETQAEKRKVMESIRSAINLYLGEEQKQQSFFPQHQQKIVESEYSGKLKMNDFTGKEVDFQQECPKGMMENNLNIGLKEGPDGKKQVDLSNLSQNDIASLRILSGIDNIN